MFKFIYNIFISWLTSEQPVQGFPKCDFEKLRYEIRPSDVLLMEGRSRVSEVIKSITQSAWSHSVLYIGRMHDIEDEATRELASKFYQGKPDVQLIIEGVIGKGTVITPLSEYKKDHIRICRPRGLSPTDAQKVIAYAVSKLGTYYDIRHVFDLARFMLPWGILPRRWRSHLFQQHAGESTKTVCSTVIAEAFNSVDFPILPYLKQHSEHGIELIHRNPKLFTPSDFDYSPYFEIIKYPFIAFDDHAMYRKLPWNREGILSHDEHRDRSAAYSDVVNYATKTNTTSQPKKPEIEKLDAHAETSPDPTDPKKKSGK